MSVSLLPTLALVLVPVVTGFTSVLWSPIAALSWTALALLNAVTYGLVWGAIALARPEDPGLADVVRVNRGGHRPQDGTWLAGMSVCAP